MIRVMFKFNKAPGLEDTGLIKVILWAVPVAFALTRDMYNDQIGHDRAVVGSLNYKHIQDLLDRSTSNGKYRQPEGENTGADILEQGIPPAAFMSMPSIEGIRRSNYRRSPGWASGNYRILLQSYTYGNVENIKWSQRSKAKGLVASQHYADENTLFDPADLDIEVQQELPEDNNFNGVTLVLAYSLDPVTGQYEAYIGQSKNPESSKDSCWHWREKLLSSSILVKAPDISTPQTHLGSAASPNVDDTLVRLKLPTLGKEIREANG